MKLNRLMAIAAAIAISSIILACGGGSSATPTAGTTTQTTTAPAIVSAPTLAPGTLTVYAASSLTDAFKEIGTAFDAAHPGITTEFNFAGSPTLRTQLEQGAKADVLAVADEPNMQTALDKQIVGDTGSVFVKNRLAIIVPKSNPANLSSPTDLAKPGLKLVVAAADVPVGTYARNSIDKMAADASFGAGFSQKVLANVVSEEPNVKAVVAKVQLGEADAGIVYSTDVTPGVAGDITKIEIPDAYNVIASYPMAVTTGAAHPTGRTGVHRLRALERRSGDPA